MLIFKYWLFFKPCMEERHLMYLMFAQGEHPVVVATEKPGDVEVKLDLGLRNYTWKYASPPSWSKDKNRTYAIGEARANLSQDRKGTFMVLDRFNLEHVIKIVQAVQNATNS